MSSPFRGTQNHLLFMPLFYEVAKAQKGVSEEEALTRAIFSIEGKIPSLVNARETYVSFEDTSGYGWSLKYLENFEHFQRLCKCPWFKKLKKQWDYEIETKLKERALKVIQDLMLDEESPEGTRLSAAKYLAEKGWERRHAPSNTGKGRPSKKEVEKKVKEIAERRSQEHKDLERIKGIIGVVEGGKRTATRTRKNSK